MPSEDSDQPGHPCAQWVAKDLFSSCRQWKLWSDWVDAQADLSLPWVHMSFFWFCHEVAHCSNFRIITCTQCTVNSLYNIGVGPQWFMALKWICRRNDFLLFWLQDEKTQNKCAVISTWFAMSESLISNLDKLANWLKHIVEQYFRIRFFDKYLFLRNNSAKAEI